MQLLESGEAEPLLTLAIASKMTQQFFFKSQIGFKIRSTLKMFSRVLISDNLSRDKGMGLMFSPKCQGE